MDEMIRRVAQMEVFFTLAKETGNREALKILSAYMESGLWQADYLLDEMGLFPPTLKRGVLSQDALYSLLQKSADRIS